MTDFVLQHTSLAAVVRSLVQYNKIFKSSFDAFFDVARTSSVRKDMAPRGSMESATEATIRQYVRVTGLM